MTQASNKPTTSEHSGLCCLCLVTAQALYKRLSADRGSIFRFVWLCERHEQEVQSDPADMAEAIMVKDLNYLRLGDVELYHDYRVPAQVVTQQDEQPRLL